MTALSRLALSRRSGSAVAVVLVCLVAAACGQAPAPGSVGPTSATGGSAGPASSTATGPHGVTLVAFSDTADPAAGAAKELELVHEVRDDADMAARLGENGAAAFATLDGVEAEVAQGWLAEAADAIESGDFAAAPADPLLGHLASLGFGERGGIGAPGAIDVSIFAETGFTATALMTLFSEIVQQADQSQNGSVPREESQTQESDGLRQKVDMHLTYVIATGGGKVSLDVIMSATDTISSSADSSFVGLYTSTSTGHFDVDACPDESGVAKGTYAFETKHELNDVSGAANAQSGAGRTVGAPFKLINGEDAHLVQVEANLDLGAHARGPGAAGGGGPYDWNAAQQVAIVMPAGGGATTGTGGSMTVTGTGAEAASGAMLFSSAMTQLFLGQIGKEAEKFWRSGKCIELKPSDDTRSVDANEEIDLRIDAKEVFGGHEIDKPITAAFSGKKSISPPGQPVDEPATFHFVAGEEQGDEGTIDLKQVSNRGIGLRQVVYTVEMLKLRAEINATVKVDFGGNRYDSTIHLPATTLEAADDGSSKGKATVSWTTTYTPPAGCDPKTYEGTFESEVTAKPDPADPDRVLVRASYIPGPIHNETINCNGLSFPFSGGTLLAGWAMLGTSDHAVAIDGSTDVTTPLPGGSQKTTIKINKAPPSSP